MGRLVASLLYATSPRDPVALIAAVVVLVTAALMASIIPTWRATHTHPAIVLRAE